MLFFLQVLAFLQLSLIPGLLILKWSRWKEIGFVRGLIAAAVISAPVNYLLVVLMFATKTFRPMVVLFVIGVELAELLCAYRKEIGGFLRRETRLELPEIKYTGAPLLFLLLAGFTLAFAFFGLFSDFSGIFLSWDSVLSWNRWASEWASGSLPFNTRGYPQLTPCNWALCYKLYGGDLPFVPHGMCYYYSFLVMLMMFDLGLRTKRTGFFIAVPLYAFFVFNIDFGDGGGEADFVIMFFSFAMFYFFLNARGKTGWVPPLLCAAVAACAAAATKQSGLFIFLLLPVLSLCCLEIRRKFRAALIYLLLGAVLILPYYVFLARQLETGRDRTNVTHMVSGIYGDRPLSVRAAAAGQLFLCRFMLGIRAGVASPRWIPYHEGGSLIDLWTWHVFPMLAALGLLGFALWRMDRFWLGITLLIILPYVLVWSVTFCYDLRNLGPVVALFACALGIGFEPLAGHRFRNRELIGAGIVVLLFLSLFYTRERILVRHRLLVNNIGDPALNIMIRSIDPKRKIATDYEFIRHQPGLEKSLFYVEYSSPWKKPFDRHLSVFTDSAIGYILLPRYAHQQFKDDIARRIKEGKLIRIFQRSGYVLLEKIEHE